MYINVYECVYMHINVCKCIDAEGGEPPPAPPHPQPLPPEEGAIYCDVCEMWLRRGKQVEGHLHPGHGQYLLPQLQVALFGGCTVSLDPEQNIARAGDEDVVVHVSLSFPHTRVVWFLGDGNIWEARHRHLS